MFTAGNFSIYPHVRPHRFTVVFRSVNLFLQSLLKNIGLRSIITPQLARALRFDPGPIFFSNERKKVIIWGPPRGKRDGVIWHWLERKNVNWMKNLCYCVNYQYGTQLDWVNLAWTWLSGIFWALFVQKTCLKAGFRGPFLGPLI